MDMDDFDADLVAEGEKMQELLRRSGGSRTAVVRDQNVPNGQEFAAHDNRRCRRLLDDPPQRFRLLLRVPVEEVGLAADDEEVVVFHVFDDPLKRNAFLHDFRMHDPALLEGCIEL